MCLNIEYLTMPTMKELVGVAKGIEKTASDMYVVDCGETTRRLMTSYTTSLDKQQKKLDELRYIELYNILINLSIFRKQVTDMNLRAVFEEKLVADIQMRQEGLERFIMRMKYQLIDAEEKWASIYYQFLQQQKVFNHKL